MDGSSVWRYISIELPGSGTEAQMRLAFAMAIVCLQAGCVYLFSANAHKMDRLKIGMTREEVVAAMGGPVSVGADRQSETLYYRLSETREDAFSNSTTTFFVTLVEGRVDSFGRVVDPAESQQRLLREIRGSCPPAPMCPPAPACVCPP
jgi:hypothetical protein